MSTERIYLDNAATTPVDPVVLEAMLPYYKDHFGNPSSIHTHGNRAKTAVEKARKKVAHLLNVAPAEVFFTSGGTESDNMAIRCGIRSLGIKRAITSKIEHHAVLHTLEELAEDGIITLEYVQLLEDGSIDYSHLESLLEGQPKTFVSLMHGNNEIGNILDLDLVSEICQRHNAIFHSDTVQSLGHFPIDLQKTKIHFITGSAHKLHGPKGIGMLYIHPEVRIHPFQTGGAQERNMRGGTENVAGIVGFSEALERSCVEMNAHRDHILSLKKKFIEGLKELFGEEVSFNGRSSMLDASTLYTVLNVNFPSSEVDDMLLFTLDIHGISASGGSACSSGSNIGSHVLQEVKKGKNGPSIRFSFSKLNTEEEIQKTLKVLAEIFHKAKV